MEAEWTVEDFRAQAREIASIYRCHALEIDQLADRDWMPDVNQGVWELGKIWQRTEAALATVAAELESD